MKKRIGAFCLAGFHWRLNQPARPAFTPATPQVIREKRRERTTPEQPASRQIVRQRDIASQMSRPTRDFPCQTVSLCVKQLQRQRKSRCVAGMRTTPPRSGKTAIARQEATHVKATARELASKGRLHFHRNSKRSRNVRPTPGRPPKRRDVHPRPTATKAPSRCD